VRTGAEEGKVLVGVRLVAWGEEEEEDLWIFEQEACI
jgi:hypothetical protein